MPKRKANSASGGNKKAKNEAESTALAHALAWVYLGTASCWVYNCDGGCYAEVCRRRVFTEGPWMAIYQPLKSMIERDDYIAAIIIKRTDGRPVTEEMLAAAEPHLAEVRRLYLQSYNDILAATSGKWTQPVNGSLEEIMQIREPFNLRDGAWRMKFEIRGVSNGGCCGDTWYPARLQAWMGYSIKHALTDANGVVQSEELLRELIECRYVCAAAPATISMDAPEAEAPEH